MSDGYAGPLLVTAHLASPLAGEPPMLDGLLEWVASRLQGKDAEPGYKVDRQYPCPPQGSIRIPVRPEWVGGWQVPHCSNPILPPASAETVEHICKRIAVEASDLLAPEERKIVATTNTWTKSYRLPLRVRAVPKVCWFVDGNRKEVLRLLRKHVFAIGKKVADGYGRVREWTAEHCERDLSWFAPSEAGPVLMRTLPVGDWLPAGLLGARRDFGACRAPFWHPDRYGEVVAPC